MIIGFTGTRQGMTREQREALFNFMEQGKFEVAVHGGCHGGDLEFHALAESLGIQTVVRPGDKDQHDRFLGELKCDKLHDQEPYHVRNRKIVHESDILVAAPWQLMESIHHPHPIPGTWYTVKYARMVRKPVKIFFPDGVVRTEE